MSKYTTEVRFICETAAGLTESKGFNDVDALIAAAAPNVFNFTFPIYDNNYKLPLEIKILRHYYTREICAETVGLWKLFLNARLNEVMPYFNQLYTSALIEFNPLYNIDLHKEHSNENDATGTGSNSNTRTDNLSGTVNDTAETRDTGTITDARTTADSDTILRKYSDTPQGAVTGLLNDSYLTSAESTSDTASGTDNNTRTLNTTRGFTNRRTTSNTGTQANSGSSSSHIVTTDEYLEHVYGNVGGVSFSKLLKEYRDTFLNIDKMVIDSLSDLFFGLW